MVADAGETQGAVTRLLEQGAGGDRHVLDQVVPLVYDELHRLAHHQLYGKRNLTLNTTALIGEAYMKLAGDNAGTIHNRAHFFGAAARAMRQVVVDAARRRMRIKRGGDRLQITFHDDRQAADQIAVEVLELHEALERLAEHYPRQARVVECRYFGGMSTDETASALDLSRRTVVRDWTLARAWLHRALHESRAPDDR